MNKIIRSILTSQVANIGIDILYRHHSNFWTTANFFKSVRVLVRELQLCFPASRGLSRRGKLKREERPLPASDELFDEAADQIFWSKVIGFQPRPQGSLLSCAGNIGTPSQAQWHSGFEWLCKHNRLRSEPIRFVRLDSEHAQSDGKLVDRGLPELDLARGRDPRPLTKRIAASGNEIDRFSKPVSFNVLCVCLVRLNADNYRAHGS